MNFLGYGKKYIFLTTLGIDECGKRLTNSMENTNDVVVKTSGDKFRLFIKNDSSTSAYNPVFYGKLVNGGEARVEGHFGLSTISLVITIFLYLWIIGLPLYLFLMNDENIWVMIRVLLIAFSITSLMRAILRKFDIKVFAFPDRIEIRGFIPTQVIRTPAKTMQSSGVWDIYSASMML